MGKKGTEQSMTEMEKDKDICEKMTRFTWS